MGQISRRSDDFFTDDIEIIKIVVIPMVVIELRHDTLTPGFGHGDESGLDRPQAPSPWESPD